MWTFALNSICSHRVVVKPFNKFRKIHLKLFALFLFSLFVSCQVEEDLGAQQSNSVQFKTQIQDYLNAISAKKVEGSVFNSTALKAAINYQSTQSIVLNDAQTLLIADLGNVTNNDKATATKIVFYLHKDGIKQAKIVTFENSFSDYNSTIKYMLNNENGEITYSGKVLIHSVEGKFEFSGELDQGQLKAHSRAFRNNKDTLAKTSRYYTSWYRVDRIGEEIISVTFLYKICESGLDGDGTSSGDSEGTGEWAVFPPEPLDKAKFTHLAPDGVLTVYRYNAARNSWNIISISLPEVVVPNHSAHHQHLQHVQWPEHQQIVVGTQFTYQYNSFSGNWLAEPKIDIVDPCTALKNLMTNIEYKGKLQTLFENTNNADHKERGFKELLNGTFEPLVNGNNGTNRHSLDLNLDSNTKGYLHNHIDSYLNGKYDDEGTPLMDAPIPIFSPADITKFLQLIVRAHSSNTPLSEIYGTMTSSKGTYTLKYSGVYPFNFNFNNVDINEKYENYFKKGHSTEKAFLLFLKEKIGIAGIELYKTDPDGTIEKKSLDASKTVIQTPCNN